MEKEMKPRFGPIRVALADVIAGILIVASLIMIGMYLTSDDIVDMLEYSLWVAILTPWGFVLVAIAIIFNKPLKF
jgi:hypothetical protein